MVEKKAGTGQWRKLVYNKTFSDVEGVKWRLSSWKVALWMIAILLIFIALFSFFQEDQGDFLRDIFFYGIITMIVVLIAWIASNFIWKARKLFTGFLLAWILIFSLYIALGAIFSYINWMDFHFGFSVWIIITCLAGLGSKRIDGSLDKNDVGYGLLVLIILVMGNVPVFEVGGFYAQVDSLIALVSEKLSFINPQDLIAE